jgi:hypothetical protein
MYIRTILWVRLTKSGAVQRIGLRQRSTKDTLELPPHPAISDEKEEK